MLSNKPFTHPQAKDVHIQTLLAEVLVKDEHIEDLTSQILDLIDQVRPKTGQQNINTQQKKVIRDGILVDIHSSSLNSHGQIPLKLPIQMNWKRGPNMPFEMSYYLQSVMIHKKVYVGGGITSDFKDYRNYTVMEYHSHSGKWATLPQYRACDFAMAAIDNRLVLVGGEESEHKSNVLGVWGESGDQKWTHPYPGMPTPRSRCSVVVVQDRWLVVAGGWAANGELSSVVELLDTTTEQWHSGPSTPTPWASMKSAVVGDDCYFLGGLTEQSKSCTYTTEIYCVSLSTLIAQLDTQSSGELWKEIPGLLTALSAPLTISGSLVVLGGGRKGTETDLIQVYLPNSGELEWVKVGTLPDARYGCSGIMIRADELLVMGGYCVEHLNRVDIAKIQFPPS